MTRPRQGDAKIGISRTCHIDVRSICEVPSSSCEGKGGRKAPVTINMIRHAKAK